MGQNGSTAVHTRGAPSSPRERGSRTPPPRPTSPPHIPKIPNYAVPENRVLPIAAMEIPNKRQLLRPVSQELTKFHPDYADIFQYSDEDNHDDDERPSGCGDGGRPGGSGGGGDGGGGDGKENELSKGYRSSAPVANGGIHRSSLPLVNGDIHQKPNNIELSRSQSLQEKRANGHILMNGHVSSNPNGSDVQKRGRSSMLVQRTNSLDRSSAISSKNRAHKRYPSAGTSLANEASIIPEDPREHLYTHWRQDPFTNATPTVTSLPLKNSFDLDYKMNLTYAQLAEHRRQKRIADLGDKTGQKLADLNADLQDQSTVPVSPFDRSQFTPSQPTASSTTGSSDTGVSKSKKRRAPPPPSSSTTQHRDSSPGRLSLDVEPPADYDLDDPSPPLDAGSPWKPDLSRKNSNASMISKSSGNSKGQAPNAPPAPPAPPPPPMPSHAASPQKTNSATPSSTSPSKTTSLLSSDSARLIAQAKAELEALKKLEVILKEKDTAKTKNEEGDKEENKDEDEKGGAETGSAPTEQEAGTKGDTDAADDDDEGKVEGRNEAAPVSDNRSNKKRELDGATNSPRRLNSLLQHDIMLAAQARGAKGQVKAKTPVQLVKPKDPAELFREELAKAATAREERVRSEGLEKERGSEKAQDRRQSEDGMLVFKSDMVKVKRVTAEGDASSFAKKEGGANEGKPAPPPVYPKPESPLDKTPKDAKPSITKSEADLLNAYDEEHAPYESVLSRQRPPGGYNEDSVAIRKAVSHNGILDLSDDDDVHVCTSMNNKRASSTHQFTEDWKPEDDLDSDDDMMDDMTYSRSNARLEASDGFKSSIIPNKVDDLKSAKRKSSSKSTRRESESSTDEKNKFGSIRKFQKSVHKSVKNAFGSISKASGKLLRRNKSHDFGIEEIEGMKYRMTRDEDLRHKSMLVNGTHHQQHFAVNGHLSEQEFDDDEDDDDEDIIDEGRADPAAVSANDKQIRMMKRAGVAYLGTKGQIVVLPEFQTVQLDDEGNVLEDMGEDEGRAPKIYKKKKKKLTYESTLRKQEKIRAAEQFAAEIKDRERQIEIERRKQQDMEREFQRLRDVETQDRLQRLQTAQLQQQMNLLQQQQQQLSSMQFPPGSTLHPQHPHHSHQQRYGVPEFSGQHGGLYTSAAGISGVGAGHLPPLNMSSYTVQSTSPFIAPATAPITTVGGYDVNYLGNYMRMMGIQPPTSQQQWAYLLTSVQGIHPQTLFDPTSKTQNMLVSSTAGPDLSHLFPSKAPPFPDASALFPSKAPPYPDASTLVAQKASLMNILNSGQLHHSAQGSTGVLPAVIVPPTQHPSMSSSVSSRSKSVADMPSGNHVEEQNNPMYDPSEDEDAAGRKSRKSKQSSASRSGLSKGKQRPHSTAALPLTQSNVYRDVTSLQEAGVTRVHVPDYRVEDPRNVQGCQSLAAEDSEDSSSSSEDEVRVGEGSGETDNVAGNSVSVSVRMTEDTAENRFQTVQFQNGAPGSKAGSSLPPKVYGPLGYKPVTFTPSNPRVQPEVASDR